MLPWIQEHILLRNTGQALDDIRNMDYHDFIAHYHLCLAFEINDKEFDLKIAGADVGRNKIPTAQDVLYGKNRKTGGVSRQRFDPEVGNFVDN